MNIGTVMMVDDDPNIRKIAGIALSRVGKWQVVFAESGAQAVELVPVAKPDVILMDVMMPNMDGPSTFKMLKEKMDMSNIPVIFMTAKVLRQEVENYCRLGAKGVISKPFDPLTLPQTIRSILAGDVKARSYAI